MRLLKMFIDKEYKMKRSIVCIEIMIDVLGSIIISVKAKTFTSTYNARIYDY